MINKEKKNQAVLKNHNSLISVIIPVYMVEKELANMLETVSNQTYSNIEVILIDDGSTDRSSDICLQWAQKDSRFRVIHQMNSGVSVARNNGFYLSSGEYIIFLDADDEIHPNMFEKMISAIKYYHADMVCCGYKNISKNGVKEYLPNKNILARNEIFEELIFNLGFFTVVWNKMFTRELLCHNGQFIQFPQNIHICEDGLWLSRIFQNCNKAICINEPYYIWKRRRESATEGESKVRIDARYLTVLDAYEQMAHEIKPYSKKAYLKLFKIYLGVIRECMILAYSKEVNWANKSLSKGLLRRLTRDMRKFQIKTAKDILFIIKLKTEIKLIQLNAPVSIINRIQDFGA